jgi:Arginine decarboxylase (spermidine biosynthesis)
MSKKDIYGIEKWGREFFEISKKGNLAIKNPLQKNNEAIELISIIHKLNKKFSPPYILRIIDYLEYMIFQIHEKFNKSINEIGYKNKYRGVFPVKVNQQAQVVEKITSFGKKLDYGLEVGSKPELLIALGQKLSKNSLIICNGIKDEEFITLCLLSSKIGF